jgi:hypothetical protein
MGQPARKKRQNNNRTDDTIPTYRSSKIYRDLGHLHVCPVEVACSFFGYFVAFEADEAHAALGQDMSIRDLKAACKMTAKLVIGAGWRKATDKHPSCLHFGVVWLKSLEASSLVESFQENFFLRLVCN